MPEPATAQPRANLPIFQLTPPKLAEMVRVLYACSAG
jgi:hypothetical protein